ncbi:MAG: hypothetical protein Q8L47_01080 [bacterium]|nr:hypothetical protein [bacterium]
MTEDEPKYGLEKTQDEASKLKKKLEPGKATNYGEAEKQVEDDKEWFIMKLV